MLQPGGAETRTCPMTRGCGRLCPRDCLGKHAKRTFLGQDVHALCSASLPSPASVPMETKQDVADQQQSLNFTPSSWRGDQTPQNSNSVKISCNFCLKKCMQKGTIWSSCHGEQEGPLFPCLPNYMCLSFHYSLAPISGLSHPPCWKHQAEEPEIKLPNPLDYRKSKRIPEEHLLH